MALCGRSSKDSYSYLVKFLGTFKQEDPREMGAVQIEAVRAAVEFIKSPDTFQVWSQEKITEQEKRLGRDTGTHVSCTSTRFLQLQVQMLS